MKKTVSGFTIVELLIVIVVIAILAAISVVAYNGIQNRANNTKTVNAVATYAKAMILYKIDNGTHPQVTSCLGIGYSGGACRSDNTTAWTENGGNLNTVLLAPYLKGASPTPALIPTAYNSSLTITGAFYDYANSAYNPSGGGLGVIMVGTTQCPSISGTTYSSGTASTDGNFLCRYRVND